MLQMFSLRGARWRGGHWRGGHWKGGGAAEANGGPCPERGEGEGAIQRVLQPALPELDVHEEYDVIRALGEGCFAKVLLAQHRHTGSTVVLKAVRCVTRAWHRFFFNFSPLHGCIA